MIHQINEVFVIFVGNFFALFKCCRSIDQSIDMFSLIFYFFMKMLIITKNSVIGIQNLVLNHKSQPLKPNPGY